MNKIIGNNLKVFRKTIDFSQEQVAEYLGISPSAYARMERGENASWASHFNKICELFKISPEELVKKEIGNVAYKNMIDTEHVTVSDFRKIINRFELEIEDLKIIIRNLHTDKN
nr:helix-turn-helix transcriptional regulator [Flavobacterium sp. ASV13]